MKQKFLSRLLVFAMSVSLLTGLSGPVAAETVSGTEHANLDFEDGITGWDTTGTVTEENTGAQGGEKYVHLEANSSITMTIKDLKQGSYTLSAYVKGEAGKDGKITVSNTGGPDSVALLDSYKGVDTDTSSATNGQYIWRMMGHRNVLVYNGQMTITVESGSKALDLDTMELVLDSEDANTISNWDFEDGTDDWTTSGTVDVTKEDADTGEKAIRLGNDSEISQKIAVEPNTRYSVTMRAKVDKQDTFETVKVKSTYRTDSTGALGTIGELQNRTSLGDRVNIGVRSTDGTVLRQAPSGTEGYGLVTLTFETGDDQTEVEVYANTKYDEAYQDSVTVYTSKGPELADTWSGNGSDYAYVDNFDIFRIQDENYLRGADVSFLPAIEDLGGKYFANGVQQDCLRILSNHGVNSITNMIFVHAGEGARYPDSLSKVYLDEYWSGGWWMNEDGSQAELKMISPDDEESAWFDKEHSLELGKRATELGMNYLPSFHYSDTWMSNAKAFMPEDWLDTDYENEYKNTDLAHMQTIVYNYVYDFISALAENNVNVCGIKHGNEQNGGIAWPVGKGATSSGHAKLIAASYAAAEDAMPGVAGYVHTNNGYDTSSMKTFFKGLLNNGAEFDSLAFSLYGGRSSGNIISMANAISSDETLRYMDYVNVETGFSFTKYKPTMDTANSSMGQTAYYYLTPNGQYNWLLDYMQAALDTPNAYGQTRGFYYWETDWIPTPGAGSTAGGSSDINQRIMFNNGDTSIKEMGSTQDGRAGDMMDSMYAYLMRGCPKSKSAEMLTPLKDAGTYSVEVTEPTGITLSKSSITLAAGEQERLQPTVTPTDQVVSDSNITYTSSNPAVAKVTQNGFVCAVSKGDAVITASVKGNHTATINVTVTDANAAEGITLKVGDTTVTDGSTKSAAVLDKLQLTASLSGSDVTDQTVCYTSSNPDVASFLGETWQTEAGTMRQETEKTDTKAQLNVKSTGTTVITAETADKAVSVSFTLNVTKVNVTAVTLNKTEESIGYGKSLQLSATVTPSDTTKYKVHWESSDTSVAEVDQTGLVTTTGVGDVTIKAISDDNEEVYGSCLVHVLPIQVEGVSLSKTSLTLQLGSSKGLTAIVTPSNAVNKNVTWKSSDPSIADVDENGNVTGVAVGGPVTITATTENGGYTAECQVTVQAEAIPVSGVTLGEEEYYFKSDYFSDTNQDENAPMQRMEATVLPDSATNTDVTWTSDTPSVATVDEYGQVTAVSAGVATITATTVDGGYEASMKVYVPAISESFDNRDTGNTWSMGKSVTGGTLSAVVAEDSDGNHILQISGSGNGDRAIAKTFTKAVSNDKVIVDFDWNVGTVANGPCFLTITDSANHCYFGLQEDSNGVLYYGTLGTMANYNTLATTEQFGSAFNKKETWYHVNAVIDMEQEKTTLTVTSKADPSITATEEIAFVSGTSYNKDVAAIHFYGRRTNKVVLSWNPAVDNFNVYPAAAVPGAVETDKKSVKLIPVAGTRGVSATVTAKVVPAAADQELTWKSSDEGLVTVTSDGVIKAANTYDTLEEIKTGSCVVTVASAKDASIYQEINVEVSNNPNASEFFSIKDESGNTVYEMGTGGQTVSLGSGDQKQFFPVLTGGDGESDYAGVTWTSSKPKVAVIDSETGKLTAKAGGKTEITLTVTMYAGKPLTGTFEVAVTGETLADTTALETAIANAKQAKTEADDYYTEESLTEYHAALENAEDVLQRVADEKWSGDKQNVVDEAESRLNAAVAGLEKNAAITGIEITGGDAEVNINKQITLGATITPATAEETVIWTSDDLSVAVVDKNTGVVTGVGEGTATITAQGANRKVSAQTTVTVTKDLTSAYDTNGIVVTEVGSYSNRKASNAFNNARTMNMNAGSSAWSTGSSTKLGSIAVDFGSEVNVENVKSAFWSQMKYTLDVSENGENWTTVVDHSEEAAGAVDGTDKEPYVDTFPEGTVARHVRINVLENSTTGWIGITLLQINGSYATDAVAVAGISCEGITVENVSELNMETLPQTATVAMADGTENAAEVTWEETSLAKVIAADEAGTYQVYGTVTINQINYDVTCEVTVNAKAPVVVPVDKTALEQVIANAEALNESDYTKESWAVVKEALQAAKEEAAKEDATQETVDAAAKTLSDAISALVKAAAETPKTPDTPQTPDDSQNTNDSQGTDDSQDTEDAEDAQQVKVTKIALEAKQYSIAAGRKVALKPVVTPSNAANKMVVWTSSNTKYATVSANGVVTVKKAGAGKTVTITAKAADGGNAQAKVKIKIMKNAVTKISLKAKSKTVKAGKKTSIQASIRTNGKNANRKLEWTSSNTKYAVVNSKGVVVTKKAGAGKTVTITAKATDGSGKKANVKIRIKK